MTAKQRLAIVAAVLILAVVFLLPTVFKGSFGSGWISKPISLGLDLVGGVHLVYEVQTGEAVKSRLQSVANAVRADMRKDKVAIVRSKINDRNEMELSLLSDRWIEKVKEKIAKEYKDLNFVRSGEADGRIQVVFALKDGQAEKVQEESVNQAVETLRNRVDQFGVSEPLIQRSGGRRILLQMPGVTDIESVKKVVGSVAKLEFRFTPRPGGQGDSVDLKNREGDTVSVEDEVLMAGDAVADARMGFDELNQPEVFLTLTTEGGNTFRKITAENVGRNMAIILDSVVYSAPVIREAIAGGRASISGGFTVSEARQLAVVLRAGALPAPLTVLEERTVGPTLGAESIRKGIIAALMGAAWVFAFTLIYYKKTGLVAWWSLSLNAVLMLGALAAFGATLTLPGLAGLALTIGMAVDASVLIFERIRDELRNGSSRDVAVNAGFQKAWVAIFDSNVTTFLVAMILYALGSGSVRGFAVTLSIGILTTVFCATFAARAMFDLVELRGGSKGMSI